MALVGAPNVGKSSLVAVLSSGAPEVCDYPFTTRSIKMGHFFIDGRRHQACSPWAPPACTPPPPLPQDYPYAAVLLLRWLGRQMLTAVT